MMENDGLLMAPYQNSLKKIENKFFACLHIPKCPIYQGLYFIPERKLYQMYIRNNIGRYPGQIGTKKKESHPSRK
jgi:hypothetical protein